MTTLARDLTGWLRQRLSCCAQRTRFHDEGEINALLSAAETLLVVCSLAWFDAARCLDIELAPIKVRTSFIEAFSLVLRGKLGVAWTSCGLAFEERLPWYRYPSGVD